MMIFIEISPQIHIFSEFGSKIRAKKLQNRDTIAYQKKIKVIARRISWFGLVYRHIIYPFQDSQVD